jgi:hypothetical protein
MKMAVFCNYRPDDAAAITAEISVNSYQTALRSKPEDSHFHIRPYENLTFHLILY